MDIRIDKIQKIDNYTLKRNKNSNNDSQNKEHNDKFEQIIEEKTKQLKRNEKK